MNSKYLNNIKSSIVLFIMLFVLHAVVYMTKNMFSAAMATIVEDGVMTKSQTGAISACFWLFYAIFQIIGGFATDKYSPFTLVSIGVISGVISNIIIYFNNDYTVILVVWCINAIFQFGLWPGVFKIVSTQVHPDIRMKAIFWVLMSTNAGQAASMLVASYVTNWKNNFMISAIALLVILILWVFIYKKLQKDMVEEGAGDSVDESTNIQNVGMGRLIRLSGLPLLLIISFVLCTVSNGVKMCTPVMLMETYDNMPAAIATRMSILLIAFSVFGMFIAKFVRSKVTSNEVKGFNILILLSLPWMFVSCYVGNLHYIVILIALSFAIIFFAGALPLTNSFAAARFTFYGRGGTVSGILNAGGALGNVVASYIFPKLAETMPWANVAMLWLGLVLAALIIGICLISLWTKFISQQVDY